MDYDRSDIVKYWDDQYIRWDSELSEEAKQAHFAGKDAWFEERFAHILPRPNWPRGSVLDYGCGNAQYSWALMRRFRDYLGVDTSAKAIEIAYKYHPPIVYSPDGPTRQYVLLPDQLRLTGASGAFDCVVTITVLQHQPVENRKHLIEFFKTVLKPGGIYVGLEMQGNTQAWDMPPFPVEEWREAWRPIELTFDDPPEHPGWSMDNVWYGRKP